MQPCVFFIGVADFAIGIRISSGPKMILANVAHVLSYFEFEKLFDLCFCNLKVSQKCIEKFVIYIGIICPFANIRNFFEVFKKKHIVMVDKVFL